MTTTYARATTAITAAEIRTIILNDAAALGANVAGFDDLAPQRALVETDARALAAEQAIRVDLCKAGFLIEAALLGDGWFDQALTWYDMSNGAGGKGRIPATAAVWDLKVSMAAGSPSVTIAAGSRSLTAQADDGTLFTSSNVSPVTIPSGGYALVRFDCNTVGTIGNQSPGNLAHLVIGLPGLSVTNASPAVQVLTARNRESATEATARAIAKWSTIGAGWTRAAFDYLIPTIRTSITRWLVRDDNPNGPGTIEVILANAAGPSSSIENAAVLAGLGAPAVMALGCGGLSAISATTETVTVAGSIVGDGSNASLLINAKAALNLLREKYPIGGNVDGLLTVDLLSAVLMGGAWPESAPLKVTGPTGAVASIVLPGFAGAKSLALSSPLVDAVFAMTDVLAFVHSGLVVT